MQSNKIHKVILMSQFILPRHVSDLTGPSSGAFCTSCICRLCYAVIRVLLDTSSRYKAVSAHRTNLSLPWHLMFRYMNVWGIVARLRVRTTKDMSLYCSPQIACGNQLAFDSADTERIFLGDKAAETETDSLHLSSAEVKNEWRYTSCPSHAFLLLTGQYCLCLIWKCSYRKTHTSFLATGLAQLLRPTVGFDIHVQMVFWSSKVSYWFVLWIIFG